MMLLLITSAIYIGIIYKHVIKKYLGALFVERIVEPTGEMIEVVFRTS